MAMTSIKPNQKTDHRFSDDRPRGDGFTDKDAGVPAADFRKGHKNSPNNSDTDEWKKLNDHEPDETDMSYDDEINLDESTK